MADNISNPTFPIVFRQYIFMVPRKELKWAVESLKPLASDYRAGVMERVHKDIEKHLPFITNQAKPPNPDIQIIGVYALCMWYANEVVEGRASMELN